MTAKTEPVNHFVELSQINVNGKTEKKANKFTYLSWAFAVEEIMKADPTANWVIHEPKTYQVPQGLQYMVSCTVTAFNKPIYMWLPVMNHSNQAITNSTVNDINKAQMRCLVKAIACHGLGLYIYAGEDLPSDDDSQNAPQQNWQQPQQQIFYMTQAHTNELNNILANMPSEKQQAVKNSYPDFAKVADGDFESIKKRMMKTIETLAQNQNMEAVA